jgi:hypothetical protein
MDLPVAPERRARLAFTRGIPGLKRETWGTLRLFSLLGLIPMGLLYEQF